jgi:hypothetical protein
MDRIPILKLGNALLVTIQVDMHDRLATALEEDLTSKRARFSCAGLIERHRRRIAQDCASLRKVTAAKIHVQISRTRMLGILGKLPGVSSDVASPSPKFFNWIKIINQLFDLGARQMIPGPFVFESVHRQTMMLFFV